ncbi:IS5 family transposase [Hymenobacter sp. PAMC 26628]|uniref:IS5 family transposase n=1 Tax=Hymenobacter sp. PAMC 26628 TaxID=1484118 RepID=UPI000770198C|nr:IS5 family transposase [Hymenobacter sp. PAMC 26628]AMJ65841.1 hypothetical protein AXW84_10670 [Hymenobacter sp. PAMC 26628]
MRRGAAWACLPKRFGKPSSVCRRFQRPAQNDVWATVFEALKTLGLDWVMLDSTVLGPHYHSIGQKESIPVRECLGRTRGGMSTKIHACIAALNNAGRLVATAGQASLCPQALGLLQDLDTRMAIPDTSYDSDANLAYCTEKGIAVVIPNRPNRTELVPLDEEYYRDRNRIKRFFGRMKQCQQLAT